MATVNYSISDEIKEVFNVAYQGQNKKCHHRRIAKLRSRAEEIDKQPKNL